MIMMMWVQDAVRGDHGELASLLVSKGGMVLNKERELVDLADSPLSGNVRIFGGECRGKGRCLVFKHSQKIVDRKT